VAKLKANKGLPACTSREAWKCSLILIVLSIGTDRLYQVAFYFIPGARQWYWSPIGLTFHALLQPSLWLATVFWVMHTNSLRNVLRATGLIAKPTLLGWFAACVLLGLSFLYLYCGQKLKFTSPPNSNSRLLFHSGELVRFIQITCLVALAPFYEEVTMRGFLYQAFRTSYGQTTSTIIVLCVDGYFHWPQISQSLHWLAYWTIAEVLFCQL
jgi:membrane protease YdiL (CAAX protease family)